MKITTNKDKTELTITGLTGAYGLKNKGRISLEEGKFLCVADGVGSVTLWIPRKLYCFLIEGFCYYKHLQAIDRVRKDEARL